MLHDVNMGDTWYIGFGIVMGSDYYCMYYYIILWPICRNSMFLYIK